MNEDAEVAVLFSITMGLLITYFISDYIQQSWFLFALGLPLLFFAMRLL